jgi:hypothetical protein
MGKLADVLSGQVLSREALAPVCLSCGNRRLFVLETQQGCVVISIADLMALANFAKVRCGRCRCHHCIVVDYAA